ncbi:hypothetical protein BVI434_180108 [Burkholderia vietnamiensis]|nr:hypothetical protein BVI434_180108 [Burkholderia vietnamiensis]
MAVQRLKYSMSGSAGSSTRTCNWTPLDCSRQFASIRGELQSHAGQNGRITGPNLVGCKSWQRLPSLVLKRSIYMRSPILTGIPRDFERQRGRRALDTEERFPYRFRTEIAHRTHPPVNT